MSDRFRYEAGMVVGIMFGLGMLASMLAGAPGIVILVAFLTGEAAVIQAYAPARRIDAGGKY